MWVTQDSIKYFDLILIKSKTALRLGQSVFRSKSHNRLLTVYCRKDRYTDIELSSVYENGNTTILWFSLLCDIHSAYDLDTGCNTCQNTEVI